MRALTALLAIAPSLLFAEEFALTSDVSAVTIYPQGATVTRVIPFDLPAGQHDLILTDLPHSTPIHSLRVSVDGARMGSLAVRSDFVPPRPREEGAAITAAEDEVKRLERALRDGLAGVEAIALEQQAAEARVQFLRQLAEGDGIADMKVDALRDLVGMIGEETLAAQKLALDARLRAEDARMALEDLEEELDAARQALRALVPEAEERAMLAVSVSAEDQTSGALTVTYNIHEATWRPVYDVRLDRKSGALTVERGALLTQHTGENWSDVALTLSTVRPSEQTEPGQVWPLRRWIEDPADGPIPLPAGDMAQDMALGAEMSRKARAAEPVLAEAASAAFDGLAVTYSYPSPVSVASKADNIRISLGALTTSAKLVAQAVPLSDTSAFLIARITNDMGELILPGPAMYYLDDRFVGGAKLDLIAAGDRADLAFGPIDGLQLKRTVLNRNEGDRGVISKSNERTEKIEIEVRNLTGDTWPLRLLDHVPYSEQEDLEVSWHAQPKPDAQDVDGKRGVLAWEFELGAGEVKTIRLEQALQWPEGMILR